MARALAEVALAAGPAVMEEYAKGAQARDKADGSPVTAADERAEAIIVAGRVQVDGVPAHLGQRVDPRTASILVDGRPLRAPAGHVYLALNKPFGVTSTVRDRHATQTVVDLVPAPILARAGRVYPVGRLDRDSEGLVLLTNDGDWSQRVAHPSHQLAREYAVQVAGPLEASQAVALRQGSGPVPVRRPGGVPAAAGSARSLTRRTTGSQAARPTTASPDQTASATCHEPVASAIGTDSPSAGLAPSIIASR